MFYKRPWNTDPADRQDKLIFSKTTEAGGGEVRLFNKFKLLFIPDRSKAVLTSVACVCVNCYNIYVLLI